MGPQNIQPPPPSPEKCLLARNGGGGGRIYNFSLENCGFSSSDFWGVAKGSSVSWVAKFKGDKNLECKLAKGWSRSDKVIKLLLSARKLSLPGSHGMESSVPLKEKKRQATAPARALKDRSVKNKPKKRSSDLSQTWPRRRSSRVIQDQVK